MSVNTNTYPESCAVVALCTELVAAVAVRSGGGDPGGELALEVVSRIGPRISQAEREMRLPPYEGGSHLSRLLGLPAEAGDYPSAVRTVVRLASELCDSVDCDAEDVGGCRPSGHIAREIATLLPLADQELRS